MAMIATTQITSSRVNPASPCARSALPAGDVGSRTSPAFIAIGAIRHEVVSTMLPRHAVDIRIAPGVVGDRRTFQIRTVPGQRVTGAPHKRGQAFRRIRIAASVKEIKIERACKALDLNPRRFASGVAQIIEYART